MYSSKIWCSSNGSEEIRKMPCQSNCAHVGQVQVKLSPCFSMRTIASHHKVTSNANLNVNFLLCPLCLVNVGFGKVAFK